MIQDRTARTLTKESGFTIKFRRGGSQPRGYWIENGAYLGGCADHARKTIKSIKALIVFAKES